MLADGNEPRPANRTKEGGVLDLIALSVSLVVIVSGLFIFNSASKEYRVADYEVPPVAKGLSAMSSTIIPMPRATPTQ